jgi:non-canonical (house-cleaning) NTP pyrophosphatase
LPPKVAELIAGGMELGPADDQVFGRTNSKQAGGAIGLLTDDVVTRSDYYTEAIIFALVPFKNPQYYV